MALLCSIDLFPITFLTHLIACEQQNERIKRGQPGKSTIPPRPVKTGRAESDCSMRMEFA